LIISSKDNEIVKHYKKLKEKKYRDEFSEYTIEGIKIINEAIENGANISTIFVCEELLNTNNKNGQLEKLKDNLKRIENQKIINVTESIIRYLSEVINTQGILAIIKKEEEAKIDLSAELLLVLDNIQDPGNLGTIIRTADACGLNQIIISKETADPYNSKVIRSTMGSIFRVKIIREENLLEKLLEIKNDGFDIVTTSLDTDNYIYDIDYNKKVIVIGNEANGVEEDINKISDVKIKIPMLGKAESLNASVATGIVLYEYVRKKIK